MSNFYCDRPMEQIEALHYADSFAGRLEELERQAAAIADPGLMAQVDQAHAHFRYMQAEALHQLLGGGA